MSINSIDTFKRVAIENGYSRQDEMEGVDVTDYNLILYTLESANSEDYLAGCLYFKDTGEFIFIFAKQEYNFLDNYENIVSDIKENCDYYKIINVNGNDYVAYDCADSEYKGKIGFTRIETNGYIMHLVEDINY